jgi:hypothetical protein
MGKFLAPLAGAALTSGPAAAVSRAMQASATVKTFKPLTNSSVQNLLSWAVIEIAARPL